MILVTVGNAFQPFRRLLDAVELLARDGVFGSEKVAMQSGHDSAFRATCAQVRAFWPPEEFQRALNEATLVITHGGCTALEAIQRGKLPVVMPRQRRYGEHVNDHQLHFTRALAALGRVVPAYAPSELGGAVAEALRRGGRQTLPLAPSRMRELVQNALTDLLGDRAA